MLSLAFTLLGLLLSGARIVYEIFFSPSAKLARWEKWAAEGKAAARAEKDRLRATEDRIDKEPPKSGQDLIDELNKKSGPKP